MTPELEALVAALEAQRDGVLKKLAGLSEDDARRSTVPSGTNLAGLLQHLTFVEAKWFEEVAAGRQANPGAPLHGCGPRSVASRSQGRLPSGLRHEQRDHQRAGGRRRSCHAARGAPAISASVMLVVIAETARHAGHADIIREQIDGQTGR